MDFAIIETGGKQYKITPGSSLNVEHLGNPKGETVLFDKVLLTSDNGAVSVGNPYLDGVTISATVADTVKGEKIRILRFTAKSRHRRRQGHRQLLTAVQIEGGKTKREEKIKSEVKSREKAAKTKKAE